MGKSKTGVEMIRIELTNGDNIFTIEVDQQLHVVDMKELIREFVKAVNSGKLETKNEN